MGQSLMWRRIEPYLDRALELKDRERDTWLEELAREQPDIAGALRTMLAERDALDARGFLDAPAIESFARGARAGMRVGAYELERQIGRGGMGDVWLARRRDGRFEAACAFKFLDGSLTSSNRVDRFRREGHALGRLTHPNIARLLDAGATEEGVPYLALEYVDGARIDHYCDAKSLAIQDRVRLFLDVIAAVAHAHSQLVIHRDLKPSNVLVTERGEVKLLDFGIAKLLSPDPAVTEGMTRVEDIALTPDYAAPEQLLGETPSTATDVYQLGLLLYVLLTGKHPAPSSSTSAERLRNVLDGMVPLGSQLADKTLARHLRGDLDAILAKAVRKDPSERYATAQALRDDLVHYLHHEPVHARRGAALYRARKFIARNRVAALAGLAIVVSLSIGVVAQNRQRVVAEQRFEQVRELSSKLFDIDAAIRDLPGNVAARQLIVDTSLDYLTRLSNDAMRDPSLSLDLGTAYMRVARVQGIPISSNLGQLDKADQTLEQATAFIDAVLAAQPENRTAYVRKAQIAHDRMIVAGLKRPDHPALLFAQDSARWLDKYLQSGPIDANEAQQVSITFINVGNRFRLADQYDDALRLSKQAYDVAVKAGLQEQVGSALIGLGRIDRDRGALEAAVVSFRDAASIFEQLNRSKGTRVNQRRLALALLDQAEVLGLEGGLSLDRPAEAMPLLRRAFPLVDTTTHEDPNDADSRSLTFGIGRLLAELLQRTDPVAALETYDHVLRHLEEVPHNFKTERDEVRVLAGSAMVLQDLNRTNEARRRLDAAFARLRDLKMYPADEIEVSSEPQDALIALADFKIATGESQRALEICDELLNAVAASKPALDSVLWEAVDIAHLWQLVASLQRRAHADDRAEALDARRAQLWRQWNEKMPNHPFVGAQFAATNE